MRSLCLRVPRSLETKLTATAKRRRVTKSALAREALEAFLNGGRSKGVSALDLAGDLVGCLEGGPRDLATNEKYMEGFGR